jgi:hypothetical protein
MPPSSHRENADALVQQLGSEIIHDPFYLAEPWDQLALVIDLDQRTRMYGYVYTDDDWQAASPDGLEALDTAARLRQAMRQPDRAPWKRCLLTIDRMTARIAIDFDYEGTKWVPDMADMERFAAGLKPKT